MKTRVISTVLLTLALVFLPSHAASSLVYEVEPNDDCDDAYASGNTIDDDGNTYAGEAAYTYEVATNDRKDTWDLDHRYDVVFKAHYAANNALGTDLFVYDQNCNSVCAYYDVGLSKNIECPLEDSQHYYVQVWVDEPGVVSYQFEFISFEPIEHPCEEGKDQIEILLQCTLPGLL